MQKHPKITRRTPVSRKHEEMLTKKYDFKQATPVQVFRDFTDHHLNISFFVNLGYLQKINKNPTY